MTGEQLEALIAFVKSEAEYAANETINRNDCGESLRRDMFEYDFRKLFDPAALAWLND